MTARRQVPRAAAVLVAAALLAVVPAGSALAAAPAAVALRTGPALRLPGGLQQQFSLRGSRFPAGVASWSASFGDPTKPVHGTRLPTSLGHLYGSPGTYTATLTVTDRRHHRYIARVRVRDTYRPALIDLAASYPAGERHSPSVADTVPGRPLALQVELAGTRPQRGRLRVDFGDGTPPVWGATSLQHAYAATGTYRATAQYVDAQASGRTAVLTLRVGSVIAVPLVLTGAAVGSGPPQTATVTLPDGVSPVSSTVDFLPPGEPFFPPAAVARPLGPTSFALAWYGVGGIIVRIRIVGSTGVTYEGTATTQVGNPTANRTPYLQLYGSGSATPGSLTTHLGFTWGTGAETPVSWQVSCPADACVAQSGSGRPQDGAIYVQWLQPGTQTVQVTLTYADGGVGVTSASTRVYAQPQLQLFPSATTLAVGQQLSLDFTATLDWPYGSWEVDWDTAGSGGWYGFDLPAPLPLTHTYTSPGTYLVSVEVADYAGGTVVRQFTVTVS